MDPPAISLRSYGARFSKSNITQKPYDEFLLLLYLRLEDSGKLQPEEKTLADRVLKNLLGESGERWYGMDVVEKKAALKKPLEEQFRNDTQIVQQILENYPF